MHNSVAKKLFAVGSAAAMALAAFAPFAAHAAAHAAGTNVKDSTGTIYMISTDGTRRPYTSAGAFLSYGFNSFASVVDASSDDLALPTGSFIAPQDGKIFCATATKGSDVKGECSLITGGTKAAFTSASVFTGLGFSFSRAQYGDSSFLSKTSNIDNTTAAHRPGVLVNNNGTVQLVGTTGLLGIPDLATFNSWGYSFADVVPANTADKAMTQNGVMAARVAGQLSPSALASTGSTGGTVTSGNVTASLASDNPAAGTAVAGQAIADLAHFTFTGTGTVTQVVLKRIGVSADATLSNVYLYQGNTKLTDAGSVSNGTVTFTNSNGLFNVNGSATISVKSDIAASTSGQTVGIQLASFAVASGTPVSTTISGNVMTIATATLATVSVSVPTATGAGGNITAGTMNASLWSSSLTIGQRAVSMKYAAFKQVGSIPANAVQNLKLYVDGTQVGSTASLSNNTVAFDLTGSPASLTTGSHNLELRGDIIAGSSFNYSFRVMSVSDIVLVDSSYGVNVSATGTFPATPGSTTVSAGSVTVQSDSTFSATQVVKNASNVTLGQWTMKAYGEDVKVQSLNAVLNYKDSSGNATNTTATEGFNNLSLYVNGGMVGSSQNAVGATTNAATGTATSTFGTTNLFTIPAGTTVTVAIKGDMVLDSTTKVASVRADLGTPSGTFQGITSFSTSPTNATNYTGTSLSVVSASATLAKNTAYSDQAVSSNSQKQKIGSYVIQANNAEGLRVTGLTVGVGGTLGTSNMANLYLVTPDYPNGTTPEQPNSSNTFAVNFTIPTNNTITVDVYADVSNTTGTATTTLSGTGLGASSNQSVTLSSVTGQTITIGTGTLSTATLAVAQSPVSSFVAGGSSNQAVGTYNFTAASGAVTITELGFTVANTNGAVVSVTVGGVTSQVVSTTSLITGLNLVVPVGNAGLNVPVTATFAKAGTNGVSDQSVQITLAHVKYTSGSTTTSFSDNAYNAGHGTSDLTTVVGTSGVNAVAMYLVGSYPVLSVSTSNNGGLALNEQHLIDVTVTPNAAGNITASSISFTVTSSGITTGTLASERLAIGSNTISGSSCGISGTTTATSITSGATVVCTLPANYSISNGSPVTFSLYGTVGGTLGNAGASSITTSLAAASTFSWVDTTGDNSVITGSNNTTYLANYPSQSWYIHN